MKGFTLTRLPLLGCSLLLCSWWAAQHQPPGTMVSAFAGGGFGAPKPQQERRASNKKNKAKRNRSLITEIQPITKKSDEKSNSEPQQLLDKWGLPPPTIEDIFPLMPPGTEMIPIEAGKDYSLSEIQQALKKHIPLPNLEKRFNEHGVERFKSTDNLSDNDNERKPMKLRLLHYSPPVLAIDNFFTQQECLETQWVAMPDTSSGNDHLKVPVEIQSKTFSPLAQSKRTSTSWFCYYDSVPTLLCKARDVLGIDLQQMEEPQIVRYQPNQEFSWHYDEVPAPQLSNGGQRVATLLVYLNTVPEGGGGGTVFRDLMNSDCKQQLSMKPEQGSALLFFPAFADGTPDDRTLHQGEKVLGENVEKRIIQMWIHERAYRAAVPPDNRHEDAVEAVDRVSRRLRYYDNGNGDE